MYTTQFYQSYIANNKQKKHNPNNQNNDISVGFTTNTKFCSCNWDNTNFGVFIFKFQPISKNSYSNNFVHFIHHQFVHFIDPEKPVRGLINNFVHFIHPYMNPLPFFHVILVNICLPSTFVLLQTFLIGFNQGFMMSDNVKFYQVFDKFFYNNKYRSMIIKLHKGQFLQNQFRRELIFIRKVPSNVVILEFWTPMHSKCLSKLS